VVPRPACLLLEGRAAGDDLRIRAHVGGDPLLEEGEEKLLLAGEAGVQRPGRRAGLTGDLPDRRAVVAAAGEDGFGGVDEAFAGERLLLVAQGNTRCVSI
jgi:hypothetical protein